jgi:hypothetical protein
LHGRAEERHLAAGIGHVGHNRAGHGGKRVRWEGTRELRELRGGDG